jgi:hypothetical protein
LLKKVAVEPQKVKQQELKNSESEDDSMFYLFSMFIDFAVLKKIYSFIQYAVSFHRGSWQTLFTKQMT